MTRVLVRSTPLRGHDPFSVSALIDSYRRLQFTSSHLIVDGSNPARCDRYRRANVDRLAHIVQPDKADP